MDEKEQGILYIVSTPIGNLKDVTLRALEVLKEVDYILCEDTRISSRLLKKYEVSTPLKSFFKEKEKKKEDLVIEDVENGCKVALISDAGTPLINDPGYHLVKKTIEKNLSVEYIPGPSAVIAALVLSGFDPVPFTFLGYVPRSGKEREKFFENLPYMEEVVVFFETPHRIKFTLEELKKNLPDRKITIVREFSKVNQEVIRGKIEEIDIEGIVMKGEFTIVLDRYFPEKKEIFGIEEMKKCFPGTGELLSYLKWKTGLPRKYLYMLIKKL